MLVNGQREVALLDTGGFQSVVLSSLREKWSEDKVCISCIHGDEHVYPTAMGGQIFLLPVALAPKLPYAVILGNDIPTLLDLVQQTDNEKPIALNTVVWSLGQEQKKEMKLMLELGIIEVSSSEWCSPVVLVPKKDGSLRFCIHFRYLNAVSLFDSYPMARIDDLVERFGRAKYITTLDLSKGYWQVALAPEV